LARNYSMTLSGPRVAKHLGVISLRRPAPRPRWSYSFSWFFSITG
jgi:hypothetical protein